MEFCDKLMCNCAKSEISNPNRADVLNRISVGSGTLYNFVEQFLADGMIRETKVEGHRRSFIFACKGKEMLDNEYRRIQAQAMDYRRIFRRMDA